MPTDEELADAARLAYWHPHPYASPSAEDPWGSLPQATKDGWLRVARAVRQALKGNGLAGQWVEWSYNTSHHGVVLEHDHGGNMVKIAQDGDTTRTYWLNADEVLVMERDGGEHE